MWVLKIIGIIFIVSAGFFTGFSKSNSVLNRHKKMLLFCDGLSNLYEYVEQENSELETAFKNSFFKCDFLSFKNGDILCSDGDLTADDRQIIKDFLQELGRSSKKYDCGRIKSFEKIMRERLLKSETDTKQKSKIYIAFSLCMSFTLAILLI